MDDAQAPCGLGAGPREVFRSASLNRAGPPFRSPFPPLQRLRANASYHTQVPDPTPQASRSLACFGVLRGKPQHAGLRSRRPVGGVKASVLGPWSLKLH